jgi:hypothetical protein
LRKAAEVVGVSEAQAAEFIRGGLWTYRLIGGVLYTRPAIAEVAAVRQSAE